MFIASAVHDVACEENQIGGGATQGEHGFAELRGDWAAAADVEVGEVEDSEAVELGRDFGVRKLDDLDGSGELGSAECGGCLGGFLQGRFGNARLSGERTLRRGGRSVLIGIDRPRWGG